MEEECQKLMDYGFGSLKRIDKNEGKPYPLDRKMFIKNKEEYKFMQEITEKNKTGKLGKTIKVLSIIAMIYGAIIAVTRFMAKKSKEMEQENTDNPIKNYLAFMNGRNAKIIKEAVEEISITAFMGGVDLDLTEAYIAKDMDITIKAAMAGVHITVPPMVRVILDGTNIMSGFANMVPGYESEELPTVFICADCIMGGIVVEMEKKENE